MVLSCLLAAFIIMPIVEIMLLFKVYEAFGFVDTVGIVILTGAIGAFLARTQGWLVMRDIRRDLAVGIMPAPRLIDGVMILIAGVLLITPGLLTDSVGFLLLVPFVRAVIRRWLQRRFEQALRNGTVETTAWRW
jgi:UPF0716 protein FxsA